MDIIKIEFGMRKVFNLICIAATVVVLCSCDNFLDIVPDNTADVEKAFTMRAQAQKFLYTTYSYLPHYSAVGEGQYAQGKPNPAYSASQEWWDSSTQGGQHVLQGDQKVVNPYFNYWENRNDGSDMYEAIRKCNVFLANIDKVGNMKQTEKNQWKAEVTFLKAYYHFFLIRMYGPIVLYKENVSTGASENKIKIARAPVDSAFNYVIKLMDEAIDSPALPARINNQQRRYGRITKSIAYAMKAKVEVFAASPLFDGNEQYKGYENVNGNNPFDVEKGTDGDPNAKWDRAVTATKEAIDFIEANNFKLYTFQPSVSRGGLSDSTTLKMTIRNTLAAGEGNEVRPNVIWAQSSNNGGSRRSKTQILNLIRGLNPENPTNGAAQGSHAPPLKFVEKFYTEHGIPIDQDKSWDYNNRYEVKKVGKNDRYYLKQGYTTAKLNMNREPRYYADLYFDGGIYYGNGVYKGGVDNYRFIKARKGQINSLSTHQGSFYSATGYWLKKLVNYQTTLNDDGYGATQTYYSWPIMRLADLYLLYAEAKNELDGPGPEVYKYVNKVRAHAGLPIVQKAWTQYGNGEAWDYASKEGMRKIIHRERTLELIFEGHYFWDVRRWKTAPDELNSAIMGWSRTYTEPEKYYKPALIFKPSFELKDYLWPISEQELIANQQLTQNPGW